MTEQGMPAMLRQQQIVETIAAKTAAVPAGEWTRLRLRAVLLGREAHYDLVVTRPDGTSEPVDPGLDFHRDARRLRELMFREGAGTWFTMTLTLDENRSADVRFDYDGEPEVGFELADGAFRDDAERFPRDPDHTPQWLRERLGR